MVSVEKDPKVHMLSSSDDGTSSGSDEQHRANWPRNLGKIFLLASGAAIFGYAAHRAFVSGGGAAEGRATEVAQKDEVWNSAWGAPQQQQAQLQQFQQQVQPTAQNVQTQFGQVSGNLIGNLANGQGQGASQSGDMKYEIYHVKPPLTQARFPVGSPGSGQVDYGEGAEQEIPQNLHDGNPCGGDEELFQGLCYTKCKILTDGAYPYRESGLACCSESPCINPFHLHVGSIWACDGYDVGSENNGKSCPHSKGLCEEEEEQWGNMCYLQCAIVTKGEYPYRKAPATCCNQESLLACMDFFNDKTDAKFAVGEKGKPAHPPELRLTES